jgi:hypothetical protein
MREAATVRVHIYDDCDVDSQAVNVSTGFRDQVEWHSTGDAFSIEFESSPFAQKRFDVPARGCISSGPVVDEMPYATYHYTIRNRMDLAKSADPDVNVKK